MKSHSTSSDYPLILRVLVVLGWTLLTMAGAQSKELDATLQSQLIAAFTGAEQIGTFDGEHKVWPILKGSEKLGYAFETNDVVLIPAYSGKPVNTLVAIDTIGTIQFSKVLEHHEPILLVGIPEKKLFDFAEQYIGRHATDRVSVGESRIEGAIAVDAITGATVTVMVVSQGIMRSALKVSHAMGLVQSSEVQSLPMAEVRKDVFDRKDWVDLVGDGSVRRMKLVRGEVDDAFKGTPAEDVENARPDQREDVFIDLYSAYLNVPSIGRSLLGDSEHEWLMKKLKEGEHAIAVMANGMYSFKGSGFVRGGIFDRFRLQLPEDAISFRDVDYFRLSDLYAPGIPEFNEMAIFIVRPQYELNPGAPWDVELTVRKQTGPLDSEFVTFRGGYQVPEPYIDRPALVKPAAQVELMEDEAIWVSIWRNRMFQVVVVSISLILLMGIIFFQDILVRYPRLLHNLRRLFLIYTVTFIGWYSLGQLSIVNVLTFVHALMGDFRWELFLMDPVIFILWGFTAATILLWGRGIFCGWLCPFGALQELINELARKLKIKQFELPFAWHERLWAIKYLILLALFGISLESMSQAERYAEVEPFKTSITLMFQREWWFVSYAVLLLVISIFTRKVYCRYICPLGAALAVPTKLRLFDWLKRRKECGQPCQLCAVECEIQAIHPDGTINANECHHCLDCQMTYHNDNKCPPLINKKKKTKKRPGAHDGGRIPAQIIEAGNA